MKIVIETDEGTTLNQALKFMKGLERDKEIKFIKEMYVQETTKWQRVL